jgi:hypothetical protein
MWFESNNIAYNLGAVDQCNSNKTSEKFGNNNLPKNKLYISKLKLCLNSNFNSVYLILNFNSIRIRIKMNVVRIQILNLLAFI